MVNNICAVSGCGKESYPGCGLSFHSLPSDLELKKKWLEVTPGNLNKSSVVCSLHFKPEDYRTEARKRLKSGVVPSIFPKVCLDYDGWLNINLEHNINCNRNEKFCSRGNISLKSIRAGTAVIGQISFSKNHITELKEIADVDGFYSIRSLVTTADSRETEFLSSVKAKLFLENILSDVISAWILPNGEVIAVTFQVNNSPQNHTLQYDKDEYPLHSNFYVRHVDQAPVPDTASYIQKLEREREARETGDLKDNRSFLAKYWMYIVPIAIFVMISGATNPEPAPQASR